MTMIGVHKDYENEGDVSEDREIKGQISFQRWRIIEIVVQIKAMVYMLDVGMAFLREDFEY